MLHAAPEVYLISWILLYHPSPPASLSDYLLLRPGLGVISTWAFRRLQSQCTSITGPTPIPPFPSGPCWPGHPLVKTGCFRPHSLSCLPPPSNLLTAPICLPAFIDSMQATTYFLSVCQCRSLFLPLVVPAPCVCGGLLLMRWLSCLLCDKQSSCTSESLEAEWSLKA